ncbi:LacI family DNA-binding transcriptional regulator [Ruania zhangjianzhongii]|uniref:LacI family DNA-binding transcriptional regulator n=1 Tax=Ruania zhangjianzhongii TaxID=2603206 RepID=UPI0011C99621|nr:LacI family DNA-binding transcriptional regulator [Ruania zhangjianzhongii]
MDTRRPHPRPTMVDVAKIAGVSFKTVSRVVNGVATVDPVLADRVREAAAEIGYRPNQMAAALKSGSTTAMIGLVIKDVSNEFYAAITQGTSEVATERGVQLITACSPEEEVSEDAELATIFELCRRRADGLIVVPHSPDQSSLAREVAMGTPMVFVDRAPRGLAADSVVLDNARGAALAIHHLADQGHERIGMVFDSLAITAMQQRLDGARQQLRQLSLTTEHGLCRTGVHGPEASARAVAELLDRPDPPSAIFCGNNRATIGAVEEIWNRGADVAIAGFDDFRLAHLMPLPLTLVSYDATALGREAARLLFARIDGDTGPPRDLVLPVTLRQSGIRPLPPSQEER